MTRELLDFAAAPISMFIFPLFAVPDVPDESAILPLDKEFLLPRRNAPVD